MQKQILSLSNIGSICSIIGLLFIFRYSALNTLEGKAVFGFLMLISLIFIIDNIRLNNRIEQKNLTHKQEIDSYNDKLEQEKKISIVAKSLSHINLGFAKIHQISREQNVDTSKWKNAFRGLTTKISDAFTIITGSECSVCIKIFGGNDYSTGYVHTLVRDEKAIDRNTKSEKHYVSQNTAFNELFENIRSPKGRYFFENKLPFRKKYYNTSFPVYTHLNYRGCPDDWSEEQKLGVWNKMPYQSTIIVPIRPYSPEGIIDEEIMGFLCLDSKEMDVFDLSRDLILLYGICDGIYNHLVKYFVHIEKNKNNGLGMEQDYRAEN